MIGVTPKEVKRDAKLVRNLRFWVPYVVQSEPHGPRGIFNRKVLHNVIPPGFYSVHFSQDQCLCSKIMIGNCFRVFDGFWRVFPIYRD